MIELIKEYNTLPGRGPIAIMLDTKGPEVRSGDLTEPVMLAAGDTWTFTTQLGVRGENRSVSVNYEGAARAACACVPRRLCAHHCVCRLHV